VKRRAAEEMMSERGTAALEERLYCAHSRFRTLQQIKTLCAGGASPGDSNDARETNARHTTSANAANKVKMSAILCFSPSLLMMRHFAHAHRTLAISRGGARAACTLGYARHPFAGKERSWTTPT
jgi:hypothetical protein